jgi:hypothetical protein
VLNDAQKAAQQAARAQACADVAEAKFDEVFALDFPEEMLSGLYVYRLVRAVRAEAVDACWMSSVLSSVIE